MNLLKMEPEEFEAFLTESVARTLYANMQNSPIPWHKAKPDVQASWREAAGHAVTMCRFIIGERNEQERAAYIRDALP